MEVYTSKEIWREEGMINFLKLVLTLTLVCLIAALSLSVAEKLTAKAREEQDRLAKLEAVNRVLPPYDNQPDKPDAALDKLDGELDGAIVLEGVNFYVAKRDGEIVGIAFSQTTKEGYAGEIQVMLGVNLKGELIGIDVVRHLETPGLGAKIDAPEENNEFKDQFFAGKRKRPLTLKSKIMVRKDGGEIDAITGATISSRAICEAVKDGLRLFDKIKGNFVGG